jgi:hypothetical protein
MPSLAICTAFEPAAKMKCCKRTTHRVVS